MGNGVGERWAEGGRAELLPGQHHPGVTEPPGIPRWGFQRVCAAWCLCNSFPGTFTPALGSRQQASLYSLLIISLAKSSTQPWSPEMSISSTIVSLFPKNGINRVITQMHPFIRYSEGTILRSQPFWKIYWTLIKFDQCI